MAIFVVSPLLAILFSTLIAATHVLCRSLPKQLRDLTRNEKPRSSLP